MPDEPQRNQPVVKFSCPHCSKTIKAPEKLAGKRAKCPGCKQEVTVPFSVDEGPLTQAQSPPPSPKQPSLFRAALADLNDEMQNFAEPSDPMAGMVANLAKVSAKLLAALPDLPGENEKRQVIGSATEVLKNLGLMTGVNNRPVEILMKMIGVALAIVDGKPETKAELRKAMGDGWCFIATAAVGEDAPEVELLREFRDVVLSGSPLGRACIRLYRIASPPLARTIAGSDLARALVRWLIINPASRLAKASLIRRMN